MIYVLYGQPGSGKTTLGKLLAELLDTPFIIDGDEFRGMFKNIDYKLPTSGHCVDGLLPKLVILEKCTCTSPSNMGDCACIPSRMEASLKHILGSMFGFPSTLTLTDMCSKLTANVHISLYNRATINKD